MATESTIKISMQGVDNASATIKKVAGEMASFGYQSNIAMTRATKGMAVFQAGLGATQGSLGGAIGAARGMAEAIKGMGASMALAGPIALALTAATFAVTKIVEAHKKAEEERKKALEETYAAQRDGLKVYDETIDKLQKQFSLQKSLTAIKEKGIAAEKSHNLALLEQAKRRAILNGATDEEIEKISDKIALTKRADAIAANKNAVSSAQKELENIEAQIKVARQKIYDAKHKMEVADLLPGADKESAKKQEEELSKIIDSASQKLEDLAGKKTIAQAALKQAQAIAKNSYAAVDEYENYKISKEEEAAKKIAEIRKAEEKKEEEAAKKIAEIRKAENAKVLSGMRNQEKALVADLQFAYSTMTANNNASLFFGGSHSTNLLLDRIAGSKTSSTANINTNVQTMRDDLARIRAAIAKVEEV